MLSVGIQHHPSRAELLPELLRLLEPLLVDVVSDPEPDAAPSTWRTYEAALLATPAGATHRLVIQDDAEPCDHLAEAVTAAVAARPDQLLVLCVCGQPVETAREMREAAAEGRPWAELLGQRWVPTIALVWPVGLIADGLAYMAGQRWRPDFADDERIGRICQGLHVFPVATVPSLVDHPDRVPSVMDKWPAGYGKNPDRVAVIPMGGRDARGIDWSGASHRPARRYALTPVP